jgi:hypothetical protein
MRVPSDVRTYQARARLYTGDRGPWLEHLVEDEGMTMEQASEALGPWETIPYIDEKRGHMATLIKHNKEVHLAIYRKFRHRGQVTVKRITEFFKPLLDANIFLVTKLGRDDDARFIEHLGFEQLGVTIDGAIRTYILNELRMPRTRQ